MAARKTKLLQQLLFKPECWACGMPLRRERDFCDSCQKGLYRALEGEGHLLRYEGPVTGLLSCLRGSAPNMAADWCLGLLKRQGILDRWRAEAIESVVLAPQNPRRSQSGLEILGRRMAERLQVPCYRPFVKVGNRSQHGRSLNERMNSPCFIRLSMEVKGKTLLLDDVLTTGTTLDQCAYLLRRGGATDVVTFSLARQMMPSLERKKKEARKESEEMDPLLLHLFV